MTIVQTNRSISEEKGPIENDDTESCLGSNYEQDPLDHVIPLDLVVLSTEATFGCNDAEFVCVTFKVQVIVVPSTAQVDFEVFDGGRQSGIKEVHVQYNEGPIGEVDQEVLSTVDFHSICK